MTMQERMDTKKGEDRERDENLCQKFLLRYICRRSWREDSLFVSQEREREKSEGECLMQHNKVAHLSSSSLSFEDWSSADVYCNSQCSV